MMCGVEKSTKQWSSACRGSAYMSCRIGYMYMQQGKCRLVDVELQIHSHVEEVICILYRRSTTGFGIWDLPQKAPQRQNLGLWD